MRGRSLQKPKAHGLFERPFYGGNSWKFDGEDPFPKPKFFGGDGMKRNWVAV
jgi:hypothetical protein